MNYMYGLRGPQSTWDNNDNFVHSSGVMNIYIVVAFLTRDGLKSVTPHLAMQQGLDVK